MKESPSTGVWTPDGATAADSGWESLADDPRSDVRRRAVEPTTLRQVVVARSLFATVPIVVRMPDGLRSAELDHRSGFLLSLIDGKTTVEELLDLSGMGAEETLALLEDLRVRGIVEV